MDADKKACDLLVYPDAAFINDRPLKFIGCPTVATTRGGRIFAGWYYGGTKEPHMDNCNLLVMSDDGGESWSEPVLAIPSNRERMVHALDIQLWTAPDGALYVFWVQNNVHKSTDGIRPAELDCGFPWVSVDGFDFDDFEHAAWFTVCRDPDADLLEFEEPRFMAHGFLRCKPNVLDNGRWLIFDYDQYSERYPYSISDDNGKTFVKKHGAEKQKTLFDEAMAYQKRDGSIRMLARTSLGYIAESYSYDGGESFDRACITDIPNPDTRFYISRTPSGKVLLVNNDSSNTRNNMTVYLSDDDGENWIYKCLIDERVGTSYPDVDFYNGRIYLIYDRERTGAKEILFLDFTEEDIMNGSFCPAPKIIKKL